jgi:hypothetical protein
MTHSDASGQQPLRVEAILAEYLAAVDAGRAPDRAELLARYPDEAEELQAFFADHDQIDPLAAPLRPTARKTAPGAGENLADMPTLVPGSTSAAAPGNTVRYFGDYELLQEIARGGMGVVFKGRQRSLNRSVALKMIKSGELATAADIQRFRTEAEAAANLDHPNIVPIYEVGEYQGQQYFSMAYVEGGSLADRLASGPLPPTGAAELVRTLALAMQHAHDRGVVHRDLKPGNILLSGEFGGRSGEQEIGSTGPTKGTTGAGHNSHSPFPTPKIADFGLAKRSHAVEGPTLSGEIVGTPGYMAPEQAAGTPNLVGPLADVYDLGAILYACLTGRPPFQAATPLETVLQVLEQEPVRPSKLNPRVPRDLQTICLKCLEKSLVRRYGSAREVAQDLERFLNREPVRARPAGWWRTAWAWSQKRPWVLTTSAAVLLLMAFVGIYLQTTRLREARWQEQFLQAKVARLTGQPEQARILLQQTALEMPDRRLVEEALLVLQSQGKAVQTISLTEPASKALDRVDQNRDALGFPEFYLREFNLSQDGDGLFVSNGEEAIVLDLKKGALLLRLEKIDLAHMNRQGSLVISCQRDDKLRRLRIHDVFANQQKAVIPLDGAILSAAFHPDGQRLALLINTTSAGAAPIPVLSIWDVLSSKRLFTLPDSNLEKPLNWMEFTPDGRTLVVAHFASVAVNLWDLQSKQKRGAWGLPRYSKAMAMSPDGQHVACLLDNPPAISIHEIESGLQVAQLTPRPPTAAPVSRRQMRERFQNFEGPLTYSTDGKLLFSRIRGSHIVQVLSTGTTKSFTFAADTPATVLWDLSAQTEWLRLPNTEGEPVSGTPGNLLRLARAEGGELPRARLSVCHLLEMHEELDAMGLSECPWAPAPDSSEMSTFPYPMGLYFANMANRNVALIFGVICMGLFLAPAVCILVLQWRIQRGRPTSARSLTFCGVLAALTSAWGLYNLCTFLNTPGWDQPLNVGIGSISPLPALSGLSLIFFTLAAYGTSVSGQDRRAESVENKPGFRGWRRRNYVKTNVASAVGTLSGMALALLFVSMLGMQSNFWSVLLVFGIAPFSGAYGLTWASPTALRG